MANTYQCKDCGRVSQPQSSAREAAALLVVHQRWFCAPKPRGVGAAVVDANRRTRGSRG
jgi:hypothetical protein